MQIYLQNNEKVLKINHTEIEQKLKKNCTKIVQKARDYRVITA